MIYVCINSIVIGNVKTIRIDIKEKATVRIDWAGRVPMIMWGSKLPLYFEWLKCLA